MKQELRNFGYFLLVSFFRLFQVDYSNRRHLTVEFVNRKLKVKLLKHHEYVEGIGSILEKARKKYRPKDFITYSLQQSKHCNYISFQCESDDKFIQFWQGDGKIVFDYPILKNNKMGKYKYQVLGLLAEMGFYKMRSSGKLQEYFFTYETDHDGLFIKANFVNDFELASKFTSIVLREFFHQDLKQINIKVG